MHLYYHQKEMRKKLAILGSTGSIGTQTLDVVAEHPDQFEVYVLTACNNASLLVKQAREFMPDSVVIANEKKYEEVKTALKDLPIKVYAGSEAIAQVVEADAIDMVLTAMVGYSGLLPTIRAIKAGKAIALANKETLVVAGELIRDLALKYKTPIIPVDSEHSAIFQCLTGEMDNSIEKIILTASGGPFRTYSKEAFQSVTKEDALKHPRWNMGAKVTIDSATMMNKGFEVIEARWLFDLNPEQIEVVVHPQSIVHSMVQFEDGTVKAQLGVPDMRLPIRYALSYPKRLKCKAGRLSINDYATLSFEHPDTERFPHLSFAFEALRKGGNMPCIMNAANEILVAAFLNGEIAYTHMAKLLMRSMEESAFIKNPVYDDYVATDNEVRRQVQSLISQIK